MLVWIIVFIINSVICLAQENHAQSEYELGLYSKDFMVRKYAVVEDKDIRSRVESVWNRVVRMVDKRGGINYSLEILDTNDIGAWAYPGGFIVITKGLVNLTETDDELAFILAHELGHQAQGHLDKPIEKELEQRYKSFLDNKGIDGQGIVAEFTSEIARQKEIDADQYGVLYTSISGYNVTSAFSILDKIITSDKSKTHPDKETRQSMIRNRLDKIISDLELFNMGIIFYNIGEYDYAESLFRNFLNVYPSREVYNNLAVTLHQKAFKHYIPEYDISTKKTIQIDTKTQAGRIGRAVSADVMKKFIDLINQAIDNYKKAIDQDPYYAISYNNLGCAYDDIGEFDFAIAYLKKAIKLKSDYKEAYNNLAVVFIHQKDYDEAIKNLKKAIEIDGSYADPYFNLAMAYSSAKESEQIITENLKSFLEKNSDKNSPLVKLASDKLGIQIHESSVNNINKSSAHKKYLLKRRGELEEILGTASHSIKLLPTENINVYFYPEKGTKLITFGKRDIVVSIIVESKANGFSTSEINVGDTFVQLLEIYGEPKRTMASGEYYYYLYNGLLFIMQGNTVRSYVVFNID